MPPRGKDPRSYWSATPMSWVDLQLIIGSGELDVSAPDVTLCVHRSRRIALPRCGRRPDLPRLVRRTWCVRARSAPRTTTSQTRRGAAVASRCQVIPACVRSRAHSPRRAQLYAKYDTVGDYVQSHRPAKAWETLTVVNPPRLQSVTNVWHAHVFSRPRAPA